jgi:hypothetical protein
VRISCAAKRFRMRSFKHQQTSIGSNGSGGLTAARRSRCEVSGLVQLARPRRTPSFAALSRSESSPRRWPKLSHHQTAAPTKLISNRNRIPHAAFALSSQARKRLTQPPSTKFSPLLACDHQRRLPDVPPRLIPPGSGVSCTVCILHVPAGAGYRERGIVSTLRPVNQLVRPPPIHPCHRVDQ